MIYRQRTKLSFSRMIRLYARPLPPLPSANCLSVSVFQCLATRHPDRRGESGGGHGAESHNRKKSWASVNCVIVRSPHYTIDGSVLYVV
jgi:hypothetical protein